MPLADALQLLRDGCGSLFDGKVVDAFFSFYTKTYPENPVPPDDSAPLSEDQPDPRIPSRALVSFNAGGKAGFAYSEDISRHGAFIATDEDIPEGAQVDLFMTLNDTTPTITARGRVAWINTTKALKKPTYPTGFGVEILEFKGMTERFLETFLDSCLPAYRPQSIQ